MIKRIDDTNKSIIKQLQDGRKPFSAIAEELGITENTVRARVNKLVDEGVLTISGEIDPEQIPGLEVVFMGIKLSTMDLQEKAEEFLKLRGVVSVAVVTGRYDLIAQLVLCEDENLSLLQFFSSELKKVDDVLSVETYVVYRSFNLRVPYIL